MKPRLNPLAVAPEAMQSMLALEMSLRQSGLDHSLIHLVKMRASQINGCAFCLHMHSRDARAHGETEERLYLLDAWRESPLYTDRERAALAWTEALTRVADTHAPDDAYAGLDPHFTDEEKVKLTLVICTINAWNRISIGFRTVHPVSIPDRKAA
jgi:AhpD family alkylhydroperoxidase